MSTGRIGGAQGASASSVDTSSSRLEKMGIKKISSTHENLVSHQSSQDRQPISRDEAYKLLTELQDLYNTCLEARSDREFESSRSDFHRVRKEKVATRDFRTNNMTMDYRRQITSLVLEMGKLTKERLEEIELAIELGELHIEPSPILHQMTLAQLEALTHQEIWQLSQEEFIDLIKMVSEYVNEDRGSSYLTDIYQIAFNFMEWRQQNNAIPYSQQAVAEFNKIKQDIVLTGLLNDSLEFGILPEFSDSEIKLILKTAFLNFIDYLFSMAASEHSSIPANSKAIYQIAMSYIMTKYPDGFETLPNELVTMIESIEKHLNIES